MKTDIENKFYIFVRTALIKDRSSVKELAEKIGYPEKTVSAAINGKKFPYVIQAIATELNHDTKTNGPLPTCPARPEKRRRITKTNA